MWLCVCGVPCASWVGVASRSTYIISPHADACNVIIYRMAARSVVFRPKLRPTGPPLRAGWHGSRSKLRRRDIETFEKGFSPPLFAKVAAAVCSAEVLPRKELFETWEVASRIDNAFPNATRVADLAAGHGLLGWMLLILASASGRPRSAVCVDMVMPPSADTLRDVVTSAWPDLRDRMHYVEGGLQYVQADPGVLLTSVHACGPLTDMVLERAVVGNAPVAVMPCCHSMRKQPMPPEPGLTPEQFEQRAREIGHVQAIDTARIRALEGFGYRVEEATCDPEVTPYNRLIMAQPAAAGGGSGRSEWIISTESVGAKRARGSSPPPPPIELADEASVARIAGRRQIESRRAIEVSLWAPEGCELTESALAVLAKRASAARWQPRIRTAALASGSGSGATEDEAVEEGGGVVGEATGEATEEATGEGGTATASSEGWCWDSQEAVVEARRAAFVVPNAGLMPQGEEPPPPQQQEEVGVEVSLREVYHGEDGRRACAFTVAFTSTARELTKGEVTMWQARVRAALEWWGSEAGGGGGFELR